MRKSESHEGREIGGIVIKGKARHYMRFQKGEALKKAFPCRGQKRTYPSRRDFSCETTEYTEKRHGGDGRVKISSSHVQFFSKIVCHNIYTRVTHFFLLLYI